jgi:hypothetical protein
MVATEAGPGWAMVPPASIPPEMVATSAKPAPAPPLSTRTGAGIGAANQGGGQVVRDGPRPTALRLLLLSSILFLIPNNACNG